MKYDGWEYQKCNIATVFHNDLFYAMADAIDYAIEMYNEDGSIAFYELNIISFYQDNSFIQIKENMDKFKKVLNEYLTRYKVNKFISLLDHLRANGYDVLQVYKDYEN